MLFTICQVQITIYKTQKTNVKTIDKKHKELVLISVEAQTQAIEEIVIEAPIT
jgi:hypothetical protein